MEKVERIHWERIEEIYQLCQNLAVSFSLVYNEATDNWRFTVSSAAKNERYNTGEDIYCARFDDAADNVIKWLKSLREAK